MFTKVVLLFVLAIAVGVNSGVIQAPAAYISARTELAEEENDHHPQYSFSYSVEDISTGDNKHQHETRDGDSVVGQYSLLESDGTRRTVDYTADAVNGFNAVVTKSAGEHPVAKVIAPAPTKLIAAAPAPRLFSAPIYAAQPTKYITASQPVYSSAKLVSTQHVVEAPHAYSLVHQPSAVAYHHAPVVSHAPLVSTAYHAYAHEPSYYHAPAVVSHSPLTYHAPAAAIIHH